MKKQKIKIIYKYLKDEKAKVFLYTALVLATYLPVVYAQTFWGKALEELSFKNIWPFIGNLAGWSLLTIMFYSFLKIPRDVTYNNLAINFP